MRGLPADTDPSGPSASPSTIDLIVPPSPDHDAAAAAQGIRAEKVSTLYRQSVPVLLANVANAAIVSAVLWKHFHPGLLVGWVGTMLVMALARIELRRRYWRARPPAEDAPRWGRYFTIGSATAGVLWGLAAAVLITGDSLLHEVLITFVIGGMAASAAGTISCFLPAFYGYFIPSVLPLVVRLFAQGGMTHLAMGGMVALFFVLLLVVARNTHRSIDEALRFRFENDALLERLSRAARSLEQANQVLEKRVEERTRALTVRANRDEALGELGRRAVADSSIDDLCARAVRRIHETLPAAATELIQQIDSRHVRRVAACGLSRRDSAPLTDLHRQALGAVLQPLVIEDVAALGDSQDDPLRASGLRSVIATAIPLAAEPPTALCAYSREPGAFEHDEGVFLRAVAALLATAVERKQAEAAVRDRERELAALVRGSPDGILRMDASGVIDASNPAMEEITGIAGDELLGRRLQDLQLVPSEAWQQLLDNFSAEGEPDQSGPIEMIIGRPDGDHRFVEINLRRTDPSHERDGLQATVRDVSERKRAEKNRAELEEQLRQSQRVEAIGRLAGGVAHDFNNILTAVIGNLVLALRDGRLEPNTRELLLEARTAGERAAALTQQLLAFGRRQVIERKNLDMNEVLASLEPMLRRVIHEGIVLELNLSNEPVVVRVDRTQLEQVVINLVANARDAMSSGGTLTIETYLTSSPGGLPAGDYACLAVVDDGRGIEEEVIGYVFDPFFSTKEGGRGSGLGLATVHSIASQNSGRILVTSKPGEGSCFRVFLPASKEAADTIVRSGADQHLAEGGETILLVEDEALVRQTARRILEEAGYHVLYAENAAAAMSKCSDFIGPIHLLLSDVVMPGKSGPQLGEEVRALRPNTKLLFMSGYPGAALQRDGTIAGGIPLLQKPFSPERLTQRVREILDG